MVRFMRGRHAGRPQRLPASFTAPDLSFAAVAGEGSEPARTCSAVREGKLQARMTRERGSSVISGGSHGRRASSMGAYLTWMSSCPS
jgi:hypothetical protein